MRTPLGEKAFVAFPHPDARLPTRSQHRNGSRCTWSKWRSGRCVICRDPRNQS